MRGRHDAGRLLSEQACGGSGPRPTQVQRGWPRVHIRRPDELVPSIHELGHGRYHVCGAAAGAVASQRGGTATSPSIPSSRNSAQNLVPRLPAANSSSVKARTSTAMSFQLLDSSAKGLGAPVRRSVPGRPVAAYGQPDTSSPEPMTIDVALLEQDEKLQGEYHARAPPRLPSQRRAYAAVAAPAGPSGAAPGSTPTMSAHPRARPRQPHCDLPLVVEYPPEAVRDGFTFLQLNADYPGKRRLLGVAQGTTCGLSSSSHRPCRLLYRGRSSELSPELSRRCDHLS